MFDAGKFMLMAEVGIHILKEEHQSNEIRAEVSEEGVTYFDGERKLFNIGTEEKNEYIYVDKEYIKDILEDAKKVLESATDGKTIQGAKIVVNKLRLLFGE